MDGLQKNLYKFIFPHLNQQNIHEGLGLLFQLNDEINKLKCLYETEKLKNTFLTEENKYLKSTVVEHIENITKDLSKLDNTNVVNMLQLTKYQLEEQKEFSKNVNNTESNVVRT